MLSAHDLARLRADHVVTQSSTPYCRVSDRPPTHCSGCQLLTYIAVLEKIVLDTRYRNVVLR